MTMIPRETRTAVPPTLFSSVQDFLSRRSTARGTVEIDLHGLPLHFFYDWRDAPVTLVTFSGTSSAKVHHVPAWAGDGISRGLGMNRVLISDPTIKLSTDLRLAWYGGSAQQPALQDEIATLLGRLHLESERMLLFGPSGGGFAALMPAALLPETTALVSNPQTDVTRYTRAAVDRYLTTAWQIDAMDEDTVLPFRHEVVSHYAKEGSARTVYLQNAGDADHIEKHYAPFRREAHPGRRIEYILPNLGPGHIGADRESFTRLLELMRDLVDWNELVKALRGVTVTRNV